MGRRPRRHSLLLNLAATPEEALAFLHDGPPSPKGQIPVCIIEGLLGTLFRHFLTNRKTKGTKTRRLGVSEAVFVGRSLGLARSLGASYSDALSAGRKFINLDSEFRLRSEQIMEETLKDLSRHPDCLTLKCESDIVLRKLKGYKAIPAYSNRLKWLQTNVAPILISLKSMHTCDHSACLVQTDLPDKVELDEWAKCRNLGRIRHLILAHFHGSTESTVKTTLST